LVEDRSGSKPIPVTRDLAIGHCRTALNARKQRFTSDRCAFHHRRPAKIANAGEREACVFDFLFHTVKAEVRRAEKHAAEILTLKIETTVATSIR
jgi:hypothetical protein